MENCVVRLERDSRVEKAVMSMSKSKISFCFVCGMSTTTRRMGPLRRRVNYLRQVNSFMVAMSEGGGTDFLGSDGGVNDLQISCSTCFVVIKHVFDIQQKIADLQKELEEIVQSTRMKRNMVLSSPQSTSTDGVIYDARLQVKIEKDEDNFEIQHSPDMESLSIKSVVCDNYVDKELGDDEDIQSYQRKGSGGRARPKRSLNAKKKKEGTYFVWDALSNENINEDKDDDYNEGHDKADSCHDDSFEDDNEIHDTDKYIPKNMKRKTKKTNESKIKRNVMKSLRKGKSSHHSKGQDESEQICDQCEKKFPTQKKLNNHIQRMHSIRPHACTVCEKRFCSSLLLRRHIKFRHDVLHSLSSSAMGEELSSSCNTCGKKLSTYRNRVIHEIRVCHVTTWSEDELKKLSIRLLKCTEPGCSLIFERRNEFNRHSLTHTRDLELLAKIRRERREKPFPSTLAKKEAKICHICGLAVTKGHLNYHISRVHMGETKYQCGECGIKFFTRKNLARHTIAHEKRRNASSDDWRKDRGRCPYCSKDFLGSKLLRRHLREEHGHFTNEILNEEIITS